MIVHLTVQDAVGRAADEARTPGVNPYRYVAGMGPGYIEALADAQARVPAGFSVLIIRTHDDSEAPEIPADLDVTTGIPG